MPSAIVTTEPGINSYDTVANADTYHDDSARGADWVFVAPADKTRAMLSAFQLIERRLYTGSKTGGASQEAQFPRSGLTDINGDAVASDAVPQAVIDAQFEFALDISADPTIITKKTTGSTIKRVKGGPAEVEFFGGSGTSKGTRFPTIVEELLRPFLGAAGASAPVVGAPDCTPTSSFESTPEVSRGY